MNEAQEKKALEEISKELCRILREEPITTPRFGVPLWTDVLNNAMVNVEYDEDVDDVAEDVEDLRREQNVWVLSMKIQAMHDDDVTFVAWTLPTGVTAYLIESWNGVTELFAIDENGFSDERAAEYLSTYIRSVYIDREPWPDGPEIIGIAPYNVEVHLKTRTKELNLLIQAGNS